MKVKKLEETKCTVTYKVTSLICNAKFTISKSRFSNIHSYMERAVKKELPYHSIEELGETMMDLEHMFEKRGVYSGMDMITYIGCDLRA